MRNTIRLWLATRVSTVGAAASMAIVGFNTLSPNTACPAIVPASNRNDSLRTESVLIFCGGIDQGVAGRVGSLYGYQGLWCRGEAIRRRTWQFRRANPAPPAPLPATDFPHGSRHRALSRYRSRCSAP